MKSEQKVHTGIPEYLGTSTGTTYTENQFHHNSNGTRRIKKTIEFMRGDDRLLPVLVGYYDVI